MLDQKAVLEASEACLELDLLEKDDSNEFSGKQDLGDIGSRNDLEKQNWFSFIKLDNRTLLSQVNGIHSAARAPPAI